jgi:tetratricopeptide (TPR) repeat protein
LAALFVLVFGPAAGADTDPAALLKAGKADQAIHALNIAIAHAPKDAQAYNLLSRVYFQLELWDNSVRMAEKALALDPQNSSYHLAGACDGQKSGRRQPIHGFWACAQGENRV